MKLNRFTCLFIALALLVLIFHASALKAGGILKQPSRQKIEEIRETLRARQAEREALGERQALVPWKQLALSPDQLAGDKAILVRLANTMNLYRAVWTFTPVAGREAQPVRVLQCWRGEQWIALAPGEWTATAALGRPTGGRAIRLPIAPLAGRRGQVYELALTGAVEQAAMAIEREETKRREEAAKHLQAATEEGPEKGDGARSRGRTEAKGADQEEK